MNYSENDLVERIRNGDIKLLEEVYFQLKPGFIAWAKQYTGLYPEDVDDIWQEVIIIFFENVKKKKLEVLSVKLNTYLYAIGKHLIYKLMCKRQPKNESRQYQHTDNETFRYYGEEEPVEEVPLIHSQSFSKLGSSCQELLISRYYYGMSIDDILVQSGLSSKNTVSASLSRCIKQLKKIISENGIK